MPTPPKVDPVRRNPRSGPVVLPAEGRQGPVPKWPLGGHHDAAEKAAWAELWATPQAVVWERLGWTRVVARYCRIMLLAEVMDKDSLAEARQLEDRLGLTPKAMRLMLWVIAADEVGEKRASSKRSARRRVKAVG